MDVPILQGPVVVQEKPMVRFQAFRVPCPRCHGPEVEIKVWSVPAWPRRDVVQHRVVYNHCLKCGLRPPEGYIESRGDQHKPYHDIWLTYQDLEGYEQDWYNAMVNGQLV